VGRATPTTPKGHLAVVRKDLTPLNGHAFTLTMRRSHRVRALDTKRGQPCNLTLLLSRIKPCHPSPFPLRGLQPITTPSPKLTATQFHLAPASPTSLTLTKHDAHPHTGAVAGRLFATASPNPHDQRARRPSVHPFEAERHSTRRLAWNYNAIVTRGIARSWLAGRAGNRAVGSLGQALDR
jgi:hypothetical protein